MSKTLPVQIKRSSVASKIPLSSDLEVGELAVNFADQKLYTKDAGGNVLQIPGNLAIDNLTNVTIANVTTGQALKWNGTVWTNSNIAAGNLREFQLSDGTGNLYASSRTYKTGNTAAFTSSSDSSNPLRGWQYSSSSAVNGFTIGGGRSRGSLSAPTAVLAGDIVGGMFLYSYTGNGTFTYDNTVGWANSWMMYGFQDAVPTANGLAGNTSVYIAATNTGANSTPITVARFHGGNLNSTFANNITLSNGNVIVATPRTPTSASDPGVQGTIVWDTNYVYVCVATNTWKRVAISSW